MKLLSLFSCALTLTSFVVLAANASTGLKIGIIGDSTVSDYPASYGPRSGWGQQLGECLASSVTIRNEAKSGTSTKSFPEANWKRILAEKPDFILIQFAHNDAKSQDPLRYAAPDTDYRENLRRYANEARAVGAIPVFVTPVRRRTYKNGLLTTELQPYADAMKAEAAAIDVPLIDLHTLSGHLYTKLGEEGSTPYTLNNSDTEDRPGRGDRTHFTVLGARAMARLVASEFPKVDPRLAAIVQPAVMPADGTTQ